MITAGFGGIFSAAWAGQAGPPPTPFETIVDTLVSGTSWTSPDLAQSIVVEGWGAGGGGTTNTGSGGGGAYARLDAFGTAALTAYAYSIGTGGAAGGSDGTDTTFNSTSLVAKTGKGRTAGGAGGLASECTGDVAYDGGNGTAGAGNQDGGGSAGSAGAGTLATPGEPDGAGGGNQLTSILPGSGGGSTAGGQRTGAAGLIRLTHQQLADLAYPYQAGVRFGRGAFAAGSGADIVLPSVDVGDLLTCELSCDSNDTITMAGWTELTNDVNSTVIRGKVYYRFATGSDPVNITPSSTTRITWLVRRWKNAGTPTGTVANGSSTNPDPPSHTASAGNYVVIASAAVDANSGVALTSFPSGYGGRVYVPPSNNSTYSMLASCFKRVTIATAENPGAFGLSSEQWVAATIAIPAA